MWCWYNSLGRGPSQVITLCLPPFARGQCLEHSLWWCWEPAVPSRATPNTHTTPLRVSPLSFYKNIFDFEWHLCSRISIPGRDVLEPSSGIVYVQLCPDKGSLWCWGWRGTAGKMMPLFMGKHQFPTGILLQEGQKYKITPQLRKQKPGLAVQEIVMQKNPNPWGYRKKSGELYFQLKFTWIRYQTKNPGTNSRNYCWKLFFFLMKSEKSEEKTPKSLR